MGTMMAAEPSGVLKGRKTSLSSDVPFAVFTDVTPTASSPQPPWVAFTLDNQAKDFEITVFGVRCSPRIPSGIILDKFHDSGHSNSDFSRRVLVSLCKAGKNGMWNLLPMMSG